MLKFTPQVGNITYTRNGDHFIAEPTQYIKCKYGNLTFQFKYDTLFDEDGVTSKASIHIMKQGINGKVRFNNGFIEIKDNKFIFVAYHNSNCPDDTIEFTVDYDDYKHPINNFLDYLLFGSYTTPTSTINNKDGVTFNSTTRELRVRCNGFPSCVILPLPTSIDEVEIIRDKIKNIMNGLDDEFTLGEIYEMDCLKTYISMKDNVFRIKKDWSTFIIPYYEYKTVIDTYLVSLLNCYGASATN